jgi:hypothetical protein
MTNLVNLFLKYIGCFLLFTSPFLFAQNSPKPETKKEKVIQLQEVTIKTGSLIGYRGDTLVLKIDSTLAKPHANAKELLEKMAGVSVDKNGQITVMGKAVSKLTVDGQTLFGGNSKATLEALKGDMVKQLEVVDKGSVEMNIKLRDDKKNGIYGEVTGLLGTHNTNMVNARLNRISPKHFINFFFNSNNLNERSLSEQAESQIFRNTFSNPINNGAYSIIAAAVADGNQSSNRFSRAPSVSDNSGLSRSTSGGLNYSSKSFKNQWTGYVLLDYNDQKELKTDETARILNQSQQFDNGQSADNLKRFRAWSQLNGTVKVNDKNTIRLANTIVLKTENQSVISNQNSKIVDQGKTINEGVFNKMLSQDRQNFTTSQQFQYEHRYERPAKVTSVYVANYLQVQNTDKNFSNNLQKSNAVFNNHNKIVNGQNENFISLQAVHDSPLSRKILWELKADASLDYSTTNQSGYRIIDSVLTLRPSPKLSITDFKVSDRQLQVQTNLFYKTAKWSIVAGVGAWSWHTRRTTANRYFLDTLTAKLSPQFYASYQFDKYTKLAFKYVGNRLVLPNPDALLPIVDSAIIQRLSIGNPLLVNSVENQYELRFQTNIGNNSLNLSVKYQQTDKPVVSQTRFDFLGFPTQSYTQIGNVKQIDVFAFWGNFSSKAVVNYHLLGLWGSQEFINIVEDVANKIQTNTYLVLGSFKLNHFKKLTTQLDFQYVIVSQNSQSVNFQGDVTLKLEAKLTPKLYIESDTKFNLLKNLDNNLVSYPLSNFNVYGYALKKEKLRFSVGINNIFDVRNTYLFGSADNFRQVQSINRLPRLFTAGLTFYVEKWKK